MMSPSSPISDNNGSSGGVGGGAIRHRNPHSHQPSTALNIDTSPRNDSGSNNTNNGNNSSSIKLHNRHHRTHRRIISSSLFNNKIFMVLGGALVVLFVCTVGLWSQSSSSTTRYDKHSHKQKRNNNNYNRKEDIPVVADYNHDKYMQHRMKQQQHEDDGGDNDEDKKLEERINILPPPKQQQQQQQQLNSNKYQHQRHYGVNQEIEAVAAAEEGDDDDDEEEEEDDDDDEEKVENNIIMQFKRNEDNQEQHERQKQQPQQRREELRNQLRKRRNDRNRFHELPTKRKKKDINSKKEKKEVKDEEYYDNMTSSSLPEGSKPRSIYVQIDPIFNDDNEIMRLAEEDEEDQSNRYKRLKPFHITKVRRISMSRLPYDIDEDISSSDQRSVSPYPDDDHYFRNIQKILGHGNSRKYKHLMRDSQDEDCQFKYEWQEGAFPNCNVVHEYELGQLSRMLGRMARRRLRLREGDGNDLVKYLSHGYWRDVWVLSHRNVEKTLLKEGDDADEELTVLKTLRYEHDFSDRNYDRHRKDALASERLSSSPYVVDIFAFCQNTAVFEFGEGGDIDGKLWPYDEDEKVHLIAELTSWEKLDMAYQVACGIADIHDVEEDGIASIAHTDITPSQFIYIDGRWKVNDFNRCRFMREYTEDKSVCGFEVGSNPGKFRAPEEYAYEIETEKIDVYSMGNVFYAILSGLMPFEGIKQKKASQYVMEGKRPEIPDEVKESDDIAIQAILAATKACWTHDPKERPPAKKIRDELKSVMERIKTEKNTTTTTTTEA
jgi:hypothetical protein